jgi:ribosome recycling factor
MISDILKEAGNRMSQTIVRLSEELKKVRTGRAQGSLVEDVKVSYYGTETPLRELALITTPEAHLIQIKPFDRNSIGDVELAIRNADLGVNPINDGNFVRIALPPMTEERRIELAKQIKRIGEETKVSLRNIRGESWVKVQNLIKNGQATEDDKYQSEEELNKLIEKENSSVEKIISEKEKEIMKI